MPCRLSITTLLLALATAAEATDRAALEQHLMRLSGAAQALGRTQPDATVQVVVGLPWRNRAGLDRLIRDLANPQAPQYQRFLTPREFERRFAPRAARVGALTRFLAAAGLEVTEVSRSRLLVTAVGRARQVERALATQLVDVLDRGRRHIVTSSRPALPARLSAQVVAVGAGIALRSPQSGWDGAPGRQMRGISSAIGYPDSSSLQSSQQDEPPGPIDLPLDPAEVARLYAFDDLYDAGISGNASRASTIAIATAFGFDAGELQHFWSAMGIGRAADSVELISVAGRSASQVPNAEQLETTLDVQWATAMAPGAKVLVYAGTDASAHTFLKIYDRIVSDNRAAVLTTSWGRCEADHPGSYLGQVDAVFARAAAQGITVIAASGDQGAFECPDTDAPRVSFPASHPYVLAVGGTSLRPEGSDLREVVWAGSGGGVSGHYTAPPWQMRGEAMRAMADVAFNADPNSGYLLYYQANWMVLGGTSVAAPIWAAVVALANQSRQAVGRAALGLAAPMLCELGLATSLATPPFIDITEGDNGAFAAGPGFDLPTGWGVPRAAALSGALTEWTPPRDGRGGTAELVALTPTSSGGDGSARLRFERRCLSTSIDLQVRRLAPGTYTLDLDGTAVASFSADARGGAMLTLTGVDLRGQRVSIGALGGAVLFSSAPAEEPPPPVDREARADLINTGMMPAARGSLEYRAAGGRDQLTVRANGLPTGTYEVRLGGESIGTLAARTGAAAVAQFDSLGVSGQPLLTSPLCKPVILSRNGSAYLRSAIDALSPGECR